MDQDKNFSTGLLALTFNDITLVPKKISELDSRRSDKISLNAQISPNITLHIPVISIYMDSVTEAPMAIRMAQLGGMGIIHRWMTPKAQAHEVQLVKRAESLIIPNPYKVSSDATLAEIKKESKEKGVGGFLVAKEDGKLLGVVSEHDVDLHRLLGGDNLTAREVMTPLEKLIVGSPSTTLKEAVELMLRHRIKKIPLIDSEGNIRGLISKKSILRLQNKLAVRDKQDRLVVAAAVGLGEDMMERAGALVDAGADMIILAIANAYLRRAVDAVHVLRKTFPNIDLAAGVTTEYEGTKRIFDAGADTVLVGIGPGTVCETRVVAGVGVPQFTALRSAQRAARERKKFIISDGGIKMPHQFNKALVAGASACTVGSLFAGTDEAPGDVMTIDGKMVKMHRGLSSDDAKKKLDEIRGRKNDTTPDDLWEKVYKHVEAEGVESGFVPYTGSAEKALKRVTGGLRSCMTYMGSSTVQELWDVCDNGISCDCEKNHYEVVTQDGNREANPHGLSGFRT